MASPAESSLTVYCERCRVPNSIDRQCCVKCGFPLPGTQSSLHIAPESTYAGHTPQQEVGESREVTSQSTSDTAAVSPPQPLNEMLASPEPESFASGETSSSTKAASLPWYRIWIMAATKPNVETYKQIIADPGLSGMKAIFWIACPFLLDAVIVAVVLTLFAQEFGQDGTSAILQQLSSAIQAPFEAAIVLGLIHFVARLLKGQGRFRNLYCAFAALFAPIGVAGRLVSTILVLPTLAGSAAASLGGLILLAGWVGVAYMGFLTIVAIRAVYEFSWGRAVMAGLASTPLLFGYLFIASMAYD